jgi:hypothetical protein
MNEYEINFTQEYPDRNRRIYDGYVRKRMLDIYMNCLRREELKEMIIEIEEYDE